VRACKAQRKRPYVGRLTFYCSILTHDRSSSLLALLASIYGVELPRGARVKIFIWDNASTQEHYERVRLHPYCKDKNVCYLRSLENSFMCGKRHLEEAILNDWHAERNCFVIHLDDDVQLSQAWLVSAWSALVDRGWDASGSVEMWKGRRIYSGQKELDIIEQDIDGRRVKVWNWLREPVPTSEERWNVQFAGHRALLVRMEAVSRVRHDRELLIGGEDLDYSLTLRRAGCSIGIAHGSLICHRGLGEKDAEGFRTYDKVLSSWRRFYRKWGFVRRDACSEAGLPELDWLRAVSRPESRL